MRVIGTVNSTVGSEIQLISDGEGMMVIGKKTDIDDFLSFHNINDAPTRDLDFKRLTPLLNTSAKNDVDHPGTRRRGTKQYVM